MNTVQNVRPAFFSKASQMFDHVARRTGVLFFASILCLTSLGACAFIYSGDRITATVIDADTMAPIEGVNVVGLWKLKGGIEGSRVVGYANVMESVTDAAGTFVFPAWGPKPILALGELSSGAPLIIFFKRGYGYRQVSNWITSKQPNPHTSSEWTGKTILLTRFKGTSSQYALDLSQFSIEVDTMLHADPCRLLTIPRILKNLSDQARDFEREGIRNGPLTFYGPYSLQSLDRDLVERGCQSLKSKLEPMR
jgi:hypothetical protein